MSTRSTNVLLQEPVINGGRQRIGVDGEQSFKEPIRTDRCLPTLCRHEPQNSSQRPHGVITKIPESEHHVLRLLSKFNLIRDVLDWLVKNETMPMDVCTRKDQSD